MKTDPRAVRFAASSTRPGWRCHARRGLASAAVFALAAALAGCMVGPDYRKPEVRIPDSFKEGVEWQRAEANPAASISSTWWRMYGDATLDDLVERSLKANQSIAAAEAESGPTRSPGGGDVPPAAPAPDGGDEEPPTA